MWRFARRDLREGLAGGGRGLSGGRSLQRTRSALVLGEVALAFVLLAGAMLLLRSFDRLQQVDPGFSSEGVLTARVGLPRVKYPERTQLHAFGEQLLSRMEQQPGVRAVALTSDAPLGDSPPYLGFEVQGGATPAPGTVQDAAVFMTSPGYFSVLRIPLVEGRFYDADDRADGEPVVVINRTMARRYWPDRSPLGVRFTFDDPAQPDATWLRVVGVAGDIRQERLDGEPYPQAYLPFAQSPSRSMVLAIRSAGDPLALVPAVRASLAELDPDLPLTDVLTLEQRKAVSLARPRVNLTVLGGFALAALVLAAVGIYGVVAYGVVQRTRELGLRMALGAGGGSLLRMVIRQGMAPVLYGIALGFAAALAGSRVLRGLLYGVGANDPVTFVAVTFFLVAVALAAIYLPARRAARSDPMAALRAD